MVSRRSVRSRHPSSPALMASIFILVSLPVPAAAGADRTVDREWESCMLVEGEVGSVWLQDLYLPLSGPWFGDSPYFQEPPRSRLAPALAKELAPLVARIEERIQARIAPRARDGRSPVFILHLAGRERWTQARGHGAIARRDGGGTSSSEIVSARIVHAEVLTPGWVAAWEGLVARLREIVEESLGAPGDEKRRRLAQAIEAGSRALLEMASCPSSSEALEAAGILAKVEPRARMVGTSRREMARGWGGRLRDYAARLRIDPRAPFPEEPRSCPLLEILAASPSGKEFARKFRESCAEDQIDEEILHSYPFGRDLHTFEVEGLGEEEFAKARSIAVKELESRRKAGEPGSTRQEAVQLPGWGVEVAPASDDILAEKLALKGILVLRELPGGPKVGLRAGDLILDYTSLGDADLAKREWPFSGRSTLSILADRAGSGGTGGPLRVIRSSDVLTVSQDSAIEDVPFDDPVYLVESGGHVWTQEPLVHLGMVGVSAMAPRYWLDPELARTFGPLVTRVSRSSGEGQAPSSPFTFELPQAEGPIVMIRLEGKARLAEVGWTRSPHTREVVSARVISVEFLTPEWLRAFEALDAALQDSVARSLEARGDEKRARLSEAINRGAAALETMSRAREAEETRATAQRIEPRARIVRSYGRDIARVWGGSLAACAQGLGIEPSTPFPAEKERCPTLEILVESPSPVEFLAKLRERCGEDGLEEWVSYFEEKGSARWLRRLAAWEVEGAPPDLFEKLKEHARKSIEDRKAWESKQKPAEAKPNPKPDPKPGTGSGPEPSANQNLEAWDMPEWGVTLRKADGAERARSLVVRGTLVDALLPGGSSVGLREGDLILDYGSTYDLAMGGADFWSPRRLLENTARDGGALRVIRGSRIVTLEIPKK